MGKAKAKVTETKTERFQRELLEFDQRLHDKYNIPPENRIELVTSIMSGQTEGIDYDICEDCEKNVMSVLKEIDEPFDIGGMTWNVLTSHVDVPDGGMNDIVLTPPYMGDLMCELCGANEDSRVIDYTAGTGGLIVAAIRKNVKPENVAGIELSDTAFKLLNINKTVYKLGKENIVQGDSLKVDAPIKANVLLLNPPYSLPGQGMIFADKAMNEMTEGRAAVLIQENAGSGKGKPYTENILKNNSLIASISLPQDLFIGKASVKTALYVFEVGVPHDPEKEVVFIDMGIDGLKRSGRKKSKKTLTDDGTAKARYKEIVDIVNGNEKETDYYKDGEQVFRDKIDLSGAGWTFHDHRVIDLTVTEEDLRKTISEYLAFRVSNILKYGYHGEDLV